MSARKLLGLPRGALASTHPVYRAWGAMRQRCNNSKHPDFKWYGARGIKVCRRWNSFAAFFADMGSPPTPDLTLDREDNDKGYGPGNCRWATWTEQARNRRRSFLLSDGTHLGALVDKTGLRYSTVTQRIARGMSVGEALGTPLRQRGRHRVLSPRDEEELFGLHAQGRSMKELGARFGVSRSTLHRILRRSS